MQTWVAPGARVAGAVGTQVIGERPGRVSITPTLVRVTLPVLMVVNVKVISWPGPL